MALSVAYGGLHALTTGVADGARGAVRHRGWPEWRRQDPLLFKTICGIVPPLAGQIRFDGADLLALPADRSARISASRMCRKAGRCSSTLTVRENLEMGAYTAAGTQHWRHTIERIHTLFPILAERADQLAGTLSGGEQQMLAIGRGLASAPRLLMLDEPSMGLAPAVTDTIFERISQIHREDGLTILLVEQRVAEALELSDHGYVLETGTSCWTARTRRYLPMTGFGGPIWADRRRLRSERSKGERRP